MHSASSTPVSQERWNPPFPWSHARLCLLTLLCMSACTWETLGFPFPLSRHPSLVFVTSCCCSPHSDRHCCLVSSRWYSSHRLPSILVFLPLPVLHYLPSLRLQTSGSHFTVLISALLLPSPVSLPSRSSPIISVFVSFDDLRSHLTSTSQAWCGGLPLLCLLQIWSVFLRPCSALVTTNE